MKVSELWLRSIVDPKVSTKEWIEQFTQAGMEVDSLEEGNEDTILTLKVPPNRSDCLSMQGLAREWAAINKLSFSEISHKIILPNVQETFPLQIEAEEACPRYVGRIMQNVNNTVETPLWLKNRLEKAGIRSLSPVVDVTNYVMLELGQPMHAFDLAKIKSSILVRMAKNNEKIHTLEGKDILLDEKCLVIADNEEPIALAGIMGGEMSSVKENTKNIFLEAAYFDPISIRKTSQRYKLRTESSLRFERGLDPKLAVKAMERATELLLEIVGGNIGPLIERSVIEYLPTENKIFLRNSRIENILGIVIPKETVENMLLRLNMVFNATSLGWEVTVPSFRSDITLEIDLIEELARLYGYQNIPEALPSFSLAGQPLSENQLAIDKIKNYFVDRGYFEAITYSFISPEFHERLQIKEKPIVLSNPISQEMSVMRESLLPGLLQATQYNQARQVLRSRLFEIGTVFLRKGTGVEERTYLAGICTGSRLKEDWSGKSQNIDFFDVKNDLASLLQLKQGSEVNEGNGEIAEEVIFKEAFHPLMHPGKTAQICYQDKILGYVGELHPATLKEFDLQGPVILFELSLRELQTIKQPKFRELSKFPSIRRDIAVIVDEKILASQLQSAIVNCIGPLLREVWVFDVYQGKGVDTGKKSIAFGLRLQHPSRTLVEEEVNTAMAKVIQHLTDRYQAILRE